MVGHAVDMMGVGGGVGVENLAAGGARDDVSHGTVAEALSGHAEIEAGVRVASRAEAREAREAGGGAERDDADAREGDAEERARDEGCLSSRLSLGAHLRQ